MTEKITSNQENRLTDFFRDSVRALGFSKDEAQEIIENGGTFQKEVAPILKKLAIADKRFGPAVVEFNMTVPDGYNHGKQIDIFAKAVKKLKTTYYYNDDLTSENFAKATNKLEAGKKYKVKIFPILETVNSEDCMKFLRKQKAILVGGQGLTLVQDLHKDQFPERIATISFDEKDSLWKDADGFHRVPDVFRYPDGGWSFSLGGFGDQSGSSACLLCVCDC